MTVTTKKEVKLTAPASTLFTNLRAHYAERVTERKSTNELNFNPDQLNDFLADYKTKVTSGEEVGVSAVDLEKVKNFHEDFSQANRLLAIEEGFDLFEEDKESDRFMLTTNLTSNLRFTSSVYRPNSDNSDSAEEYTAITTHGEISKDSKAISAHLAGLRKTYLAD